MRHRFLPSLRRTSLDAADQTKLLLGDYYAALAQYGRGLHDRTRPWPIERAVAEGYERIVWAYKAVEAIASSQARLDFRVMDGESEVEDHPLTRLLNDGPANPMETGRVLRKRLSAQILLSKRGAFAQVTTSRAGTPVRIDLLPPGRTLIIPSEDNSPTGALIDRFLITRVNGTTFTLEPDQVRWFRDPHPIDPYSGMTPLEAAGLSVELDYFARLYNVSFLRNDGRPGGIVGVDGDVDEATLDDIERRFQRGPHAAGGVTALNAGITYADLAAKPRDMQYQQTSKNSKTEILVAFGTPDSLLGYAADRTYANAEQEERNFWSITMPPHMGIITGGFDRDSDDGLVNELDTSPISVLHKPEVDRRAEAREEFEAGLRSIYSYAQLAGIEDVEDTPQTRALYIPAAKVAIPARASDAEALAATTAAPPQQPGPPPDTSTGGTEDTGEAADTEDTGDGGPAGFDSADTTGTTAPDAGVKAITEPARPRPARHRMTRPVLRVIRGGAARTRTSAQDERARQRLEDALAAALTALAGQWTARAVAKTGSPQARKGTRHWKASPAYQTDSRVGAAPLNTSVVADADQWSDEAADTTSPIITAAAVAAALALLADLGDGDDAGAVDAVTKAAGRAAAEVLDLIRRAAAGRAAALAVAITQLDQDGADLDSIVAAVRAAGAHMAGWAARVATSAATAVTTGARDAAALVLPSAPGIVRTWRSMRDNRVRPSHRAADGQVQVLGSPFVVGHSLLRFPGDPIAPLDETVDCRCWLLYKTRVLGLPVPQPESETDLQEAAFAAAEAARARALGQTGRAAG